MQEKILYFDTETTDVQTKDIVQIAILKETGEELSMYFNPVQEVTYSAMAVHHLTPEFLEKYQPFVNATLPKDFKDTEFKGEKLKDYLEYLAENYIWVAHNIEFDAEVLEKKGITIPKQICTFKLARNMFDEEGMDIESYSLQYLRYYLGLYKKEDQRYNTAHDALSDVYFLRDLFKYIQKNSKFTLEQMMQITREPAYIRNIHFGKYAGKPLDEIVREDRAYLEWLRENLTEKDDLVWNIDRVLSMGGGTLFD